MPGYKGHIFGGITFYTVFLFILTTNWLTEAIPTHKLLLWFAVCLFGALFPDIDIHSMGQKLFFITLLPIVVFSIFSEKWVVLSICSILAYIPLITKHRGLTHKLWFSALLPIGTITTSKIYYPKYFNEITILSLFFIVGVASHLFLDFGPKKFFKNIF